MKILRMVIGLIMCMGLSIGHLKINAQEIHEFKLENPITTSFLQENLVKKSPKLILTPQIEKNLRKKLKTDPYIQKLYHFIRNEADTITTQPLLKRELQGFRLLAVSREMVERMGILCMVYRIEKDRDILERIDRELIAVCNFEDWNPQHFLDIAEMSFAVAIAVDWVGKWLPEETVSLAKSSLIEKGIKPSFNEGGTRMFWINSSNNWNAVCHSGMISASLMIADVDPELAAKTISRALEKLPNSLKEYAPHGIYPEGPTYWSYGTSYSVIASNVLTTALGTDFGIAESPGFMESATFLLQVTAPSGYFFNFADSGDEMGGAQSVLLLWFAGQTGDGLFFDKSWCENPENPGRFAGPGLIWLSQFEQEKKSELPVNWYGKGNNPVAVFRGDKDDQNSFYLAVKGGKGALSHGNLDAGSFIFELNGIRWGIDPGNQSYYPLNRIGFNLAGLCQDCPRWTLLTKKNQGHSTVTVNDDIFRVNGYAPIVDFSDEDQPEVTIDMSRLYGNSLNGLNRRFVKENNHTVLIEDKFEINDSTRFLTWGMMTQAEVLPVEHGAVLKQDGKRLKLIIEEPAGVEVSVVSLDPPPMKIDKTIENLKRIEIRTPAWIFLNNQGVIKVRLTGDPH